MVAGGALRIVFFGTPAFAVPTLDALLASSHSVVAAVTQPDRPRGRGHHVSDAPVKARALEARIPVLQPNRLNDPGFMTNLTTIDADLGVVAAYGKILTDAVLAQPRLGLINVHASLLPKYRGAAPVHRAVIAGERETGVTIMRVLKALDAGPMLAKAWRAIGPEETSEEVERDLARVGATLMMSTLDAISRGEAIETPQDESQATYAPRLMKNEGVLDWSQPAARIHDRIRGLHPWPLAFTFLNDRRVILRRSTGAAGNQIAEPGVVIEASGDRLVVATGSGALAIGELQLEGRRPMTAREFLAGHAVARGDRFRTAA